MNNSQLNTLQVAAKAHAERVLEDPQYRPYETLIKRKEDKFKEEARQTRVTKEFMERIYE